ncbi:hypothetical protein L1D15_09855 [Vibrio sp. Isolate25]|uniref:hypothetical protein n=1 Tax=Vibrio sp. Isolate25 TaxID=2908535 RepID=UPI001EFCF720|nr:hypothetical protein [Vibrio sp. Isolate25]MCG9597029.1 hypothetical protein [Vibrio sp. Isolate25]
MKNQLVDLNNHLFAQMERLSDEDLKGAELEKELERTKAMTNISRQIIDNASLALEGAKFKAEFAGKYEVPMMEDKRHA